MKAAWYDRTGPAGEVIRVGELPTPAPAPGELLVRVHASGVNPSDYKRRAGWLGMKMPYSRVVPHSDGAGVVEEVGAGVPPDRIGERVWLWNAQGGERPYGTAAEYVALPADQAVPLPEKVGFDVGSALGVPGCTAHHAVFSDGSVDGKSVLVSGGAGAVGFYAIQMAQQGGARVIATVSSDEKASVAREAGADSVFDYVHRSPWEPILELTDGEGVDRIIEVDFGANLEIDSAVIKQGGVIASYSSTRIPKPVLPYYPLAFKGVTVRFVQGFTLPAPARQAAIRDLTDWLEHGRLKTRIAARFPLEQTAAAHEAAEGGRLIGKVVVEVA